MSDFHDPIPLNVRKDVIQDAAERFARKQNLEPGFSIESLVRKLGGRIEYREPMGNSRDAESIRVNAERNFVIYLATDTSPLRDRFTIAHELAHYLLHYPQVVERYGANSKMRATRFVDETKADLVRAEWEANWFAAALLMPSEEFKELWDEHKGDAYIASYFEVTKKAVDVRAKSLQLQ